MQGTLQALRGAGYALRGRKETRRQGPRRKRRRPDRHAAFPRFGGGVGEGRHGSSQLSIRLDVHKNGTAGSRLWTASHKSAEQSPAYVAGVARDRGQKAWYTALDGLRTLDSVEAFAA